MEKSVEWCLCNRELCRISPTVFRRELIVTPNLINRFGNTKTLVGHEGCVNCLQWNESGTLLTSGSDDMTIRLWNTEGHCVHSFNSGHLNNIFSVKFLPGGRDEIILSAAGDSSVRMHSYNHSDTPYVWWSGGRVKCLALTGADPYVFWSASEDGVVKQYDVRTCNATGILKLDGKECKSVALNTTRPEMMAVALNEAGVPLYDRRNMAKPVYTLIPGHIPITEESSRHTFRSFSVTHVGFNSTGNELLVNIGGEQIYIFNVIDRVNEPDALEKLNVFLSSPARLPSGPDDKTTVEQKNTNRFKAQRERAKVFFNNKNYTDAIDLYSQALCECEKLCGYDPLPSHPHAMDLCLLLTNRGAGYLRRMWEGDAYACLLDMIRALKIEPRNIKCHYRVVKSLMELKQYDLARQVSQLFKERFPSDRSCDKLDSVLRSDPGVSMEWKSRRSPEYVQRLCGHCNTNTDIKEAVWWGCRDEYIAAGSDCGSLLIWERKTGALIKAFEADKNILNCVQPHPSICLLATSGIEHVIRYWEPLPERDDQDATTSRRERRSLTELSITNQKRMRTGLFEMVIASFGFAMQSESEDEEGAQGRRVGCSAS